MRFATDAVFAMIDQSLITTGGVDGGGSGDSWFGVATRSERGRVGRTVGYGRLERDALGNLIRTRLDADANRVNRGGSWATRLSVPVSFSGSNATAQAPVHYDIVKSAGLQGTTSWSQVVKPGASGPVVSHHPIQAAFPGMDNAEAKQLGQQLYAGGTDSGDFSELFSRLVVLADDLFTGVGFAPRVLPVGATTYNNVVDRFWPSSAGSYVPLLGSFNRLERQYRLVGSRDAALLTPAVVRCLWYISANNNNVAAGVAGRNSYSNHASFNSSLGIWILGPKGPENIDLGGQGGAIVNPPALDDVMRGIEWLLAVSGDKVGFELATSLISERIPFSELALSSTGTPLGWRVGAAVPDELDRRLTLVAEMNASWTAGVNSPGLRAAYEGVFGAGTLSNDVHYAANRGAAVDNLQAQFLGYSHIMDYMALMRGLTQVGGFRTFQDELLRDEVVLALGMVNHPMVLPLRLVNEAGTAVTTDRWPALPAHRGFTGNDLITALGSPGALALPAVGVRVHTSIASSNGCAVWCAVINNAHESGAPADSFARVMMPPALEFVTTVAIVAAHLRAVADEVESSIGRCAHLATLMSGGEPVAAGGAPVWDIEDLEHAQDVFTGRNFCSGLVQLGRTRGARRLLWSALPARTGSAERVQICSAQHEAWDMAVCFSGLQREVLTGLSASVGGLIANLQLFTHLHRKCPGFLNTNIVESDLSRANRLHVLSAFVGLGAQSIDLDYQVRYQRVELSTYADYTIPFGRLRRVRCEGSTLAGEVVTNMCWRRALAEQQLRITSIDAVVGGSLLQGRSLLHFVVGDDWVPEAASPAEQDPASQCPQLRFGEQVDLLGRWRCKVGAPAALVPPAGVDLMRFVTDALAAGVSSGRRLLSTGNGEVVEPWARSSVGTPAVELPEVFLNESGANRALRDLAVKAGIPDPAVAVAAAMERDRLRQQEEQRVAENAPAAQSLAMLQTLAAQVAALQAQLAAGALVGAGGGGQLDSNIPGMVPASSDSHAGGKSATSGLTAVTEATTTGGGSDSKVHFGSVGQE